MGKGNGVGSTSNFLSKLALTHLEFMGPKKRGETYESGKKNRFAPIHPLDPTEGMVSGCQPEHGQIILPTIRKKEIR